MMKKSQVKYSRGYPPRRQAGSPRRYLGHRAEKEKFWKKRIIFFWLLFLAGGLIYILFFSPIFEIKEIKISGNRVIDSKEIKSLIDKKNLFLATNTNLRETLLNNFSRIASVDISKDIFKKIIELEISERKEAGIFCSEDCYYIDKEGVIFEKAPLTSGTLILVIKDNSKRKVNIGDRALEEDFLAELVELRDYFSHQFNFKIFDFLVDVSDLRVNTNEGWYILFDKSRDLRDQIEALKLVLDEKIKENRKSLEYIDLRIENRVYYK